MKRPATLASVAATLLILAGCASKQPAPVVDRMKPAQTSGAAEAKDANPASSGERVAARGFYIVRAGDTLYKISLDHGHGYKDVASWNSLESPYRIVPGQELRVVPPDSEAQPVAVARPVVMSKAVESKPLDESPDGAKREPRAGREPYSDDAYAKAMKGGEVALARVEIKADPKPVPAESSGGDPRWVWPATGKLLTQFGENGKKGLEVAGRMGEPIVASADGKIVYSGAALKGYGQLLIVKHSPVYLSVYAHNSKVVVKEQEAVRRGQKIAEMGDSDADQVKLYFEIREQGKQIDPAKLLPAR